MGGQWNHNTHYYGHIATAMPRPCRSALDIGCGNGALLRLIADGVDRVVGIDPDLPSIREARELSADDARISFIEDDFLSHDFDNEAFDFITAVAVLHHLPLEPAIEHVTGLLRPGGVLCVVGCARPAGPVDLAYDVAGSISNRFVRLRRSWWQHGAPTAEAAISYREVRAAARVHLPGHAFRRRLYYRYTLEWTRPALPSTTVPTT